MQVMVGGKGRSGTTWVAEILNYNNTFEYLFEPLHPDKNPTLAAFDWKQYVPPEDDDLEKRRAMQRILAGPIDSEFVNQFNNQPDTHHRLVKVIRINLMAKWLANNFPDLKLIFIVRHPLAVALSLTRNQWPSDWNLILRQENLVDQYLKPFLPFMDENQPLVTQHLISWCIEHYVLFHQLDPDDALFVHYEDLCLQPETELDRMFSCIGLTWDRSVLEKIRKPSELANDRSAVTRGKDPVRDWQKEFAPESLDAALHLLTLFSLDEIYTTDPLPKKRVWDSTFMKT